jgi:hypothetical protein
MEWISVKDRLPEDNEVVLLYYENDFLGTEYFVGHIQIKYSDGETRFKECNGNLVYNIPATHWAYLEKPKQ